jgi:hypothetical protein
MRDVVEMAREVYGAHTEWAGAPLIRLEQLVALVRADERALAAPVQKAMPENWFAAPVQKAMPENWFAGMPKEYREEAWRVVTPPAAQPAVPDAIIEAGESPDYRDGWNDCRALMLEMRKP